MLVKLESIQLLMENKLDAMDKIKKDESYTEDTLKKEEESIQKLTDQFVKKVDEIVKEKDSEIMSI